MHVIVIEARRYQPSVEIDDASLVASVFVHAVVLSYVDDGVAANGYCFGPRVVVVDGPDDAVAKDEIRLLRLGEQRPAERQKQSGIEDGFHRCAPPPACVHAFTIVGLLWRIKSAGRVSKGVTMRRCKGVRDNYRPLAFCH